LFINTFIIVTLAAVQGGVGDRGEDGRWRDGRSTLEEAGADGRRLRMEGWADGRCLRSQGPTLEEAGPALEAGDVRWHVKETLVVGEESLHMSEREG
jgi:hypothetical protein